MHRILYTIIISNLSFFSLSAQEDQDPKFVSLREAHDGKLEIDLKILNQFHQQPKETIAFYTKYLNQSN